MKRKRNGGKHVWEALGATFADTPQSWQRSLRNGFVIGKRKKPDPNRYA